MPTLKERFKAFLDPQPATIARSLGEVAQADPSRGIFGKWKSTPYNPSELVSKKGMAVFDRMKKDDQVKAALLFKKHAVMAGGWKIEVPEGQPEEWEPAKFIEWTLKNGNQEWDRILEASFDHALIEILTAIDYGFSITEKVLTPLEFGPFAGKIGLQALKTRKPHDFEFSTDEWGNLLQNGIMQRQSGGNKDLPREKFLIYVYQHQFSNWYGESDLEAAYRPWWIKDNAYKWLAMLLERYGVPSVFFLYGQGYTDAQINALKKIAQNWQSATSGVIHKPTKDALDTWAPELAKQAEIFINSLEKFDRDIARSILMPSLIGATSDGETGSYARSQTHFDLFMMIVDFVRLEVSAVLNQQLVRPLTDINYDVDEYPYFCFNPIDTAKKVELLKEWLAAVKESVVEKQEGDEDHVRAILGFPEKNEADRKKPKPSPIHGMNPNNPFDPSQEKEEREEYTVKLNRQKNKFERTVDFAQIESGLNRLEESTKEKVKEILSESREALISYVNRNLQRKPGIVKDLRLQRMGELQSTFREFFRASFEHGTQTLKSELPKKFKETGPSFVPADALKYLNEKALQVSGVLKEKLLSDAKQILLNAIKTGEPLATTIEKLNDLFDPYVGDPTVLVEGDPIAPYRLETIIRTNATDAFNQGRLVQARDPEIVRFIRGMEYSAILDGRTTEICASLDGKIIRMGDPSLSRLSPPNHFNCRSILVPVTPDIEVDDAQFASQQEIGNALELAGTGFV